MKMPPCALLDLRPDAISTQIIQRDRYAHYFTALAVAAGDTCDTMPCGICRQMLAEFGDLTVICAAAEGDQRLVTPLSSLLPHAFTAFSPER